MKAIAAVLGYNQHHLIWNMQNQLGRTFVLVDNGSEPPLTGGKMTLRLEQNHQFTGGWNHAMYKLRLRGYRWVWMLNSDLEGLYPALLPELVQIAEALGTDCAAISATYNSPHAHMHDQKAAAPRPVRWLDWAGPLVNTEWFSKVDGFDEEFVGYGSDLDLCYRLRQKGAKFYVVDWLSFLHLGSVTAIAEGNNKHLDVGYMNQLFQRKYGVSSWQEMT